VDLTPEVCRKLAYDLDLTTTAFLIVIMATEHCDRGGALLRLADYCTAVQSGFRDLKGDL
jgi:hypothetical protein